MFLGGPLSSCEEGFRKLSQFEVMLLQSHLELDVRSTSSYKAGKAVQMWVRFSNSRSGSILCGVHAGQGLWHCKPFPGFVSAVCPFLFTVVAVRFLLAVLDFSMTQCRASKHFF